MLRWIAIALIVAGLGGLARAQDKCSFGGDDSAENFVKALDSAASCTAANKTLHRCAWGSSADTQFAPVVIAKCEKTFFGKLSGGEKTNYAEQMQLCAYEFARQQGTMYISAAALCQADVAARYAADPALAHASGARASFDCTNARTPLEMVICSNIGLGHADVVLSRVYKNALSHGSPANRDALIKSERRWLEELPAKCGLAEPASPRALNCLRNAFELRFTSLDSCGDDPAASIAACADAPDDSNSSPDDAAGGSRASFDCEAPSSPLELVVCDDADLGKLDLALAQAYHDADAKMSAAQHHQLALSEAHWTDFVYASCPLGTVGGIPPLLTRACIRAAYQKRIDQMRDCPQKSATDRMACFNSFALESPTQDLH